MPEHCTLKNALSGQFYVVSFMANTHTHGPRGFNSVDFEPWPPVGISYGVLKTVYSSPVAGGGTQWPPDVVRWEETTSLLRHSRQEMGLGSKEHSVSLTR